MPNPFVKNGQAYYWDSSGSLVNIPEGETPSAEYFPATEDELRADAKKRRDEFALGVAKTFAESAATGATQFYQTVASGAGQGEFPQFSPGAGFIAPQTVAPGATRGEVSVELDRLNPRSPNFDPELAAAQGTNFAPTDVRRPLWQQLMAGSPEEERALAEQEAALRAANPITAMVGEATGQALSLPVSPVAAAETAGAKAAMGALEGMTWGGLSADSQARVDNEFASTTERLSSMALGAILGAGASFLLHTGGSGLKKTATSKSPSPAQILDETLTPPAQAESLVAGSQVTQAATLVPGEDDLGILGSVAKAIGKAQRRLGGADPEAMDLMGLGSTHPLRDVAREVVSNPQAAVRQSATEFGDALQTITDIGERIHQYEGSDAWRTEVVEQLMGDASHDAARSETAALTLRLQDAANQYGDEIGTLITNGGDESRKVLAPQLQRLYRFRDDLADIGRGVQALPGEEGHLTVPQAYSRLNAIKRQLSGHVRGMPTEAASEVRIGNTGEIVGRLRTFFGDASSEGGMYKTLRDFLEDANVWGDAGTLQREMNGGVSQYLGVSRRYHGDLGNYIGADFPSGAQRWRPDSAQMEGAVQAIGRHPNSQLAQDVGNTLDGMARALDAIRRSDARGFSGIDGAIESIRSARRAVDDSVQRVGFVRQYEEGLLAPQRRSDETRAFSPAMAGVFGAVTGGAPGAAVGVGLSMVRRPAATVHLAHGFRRMLNSLRGDRVARAARAVVSGEESVASRAVSPSAAVEAVIGSSSRKITPRAPSNDALSRAATLGGIAAFQGGKSLVEAYRERTKEIRALATEPASLAGRLSAVAPSLASEDPELAAATFSNISNVVQFIASQIPSGQQVGGPFDARPAEPTHSDMSEFARVWSAALDPLTVLEDARLGKATSKQVEIVRQLHPQAYNEIRSALMQEAAAFARTNHIPLRIKQTIDTMIGSQGWAAPDLSPSIASEILGSARKRLRGASRGGQGATLAETTETPEANWPSAR